MPPRRTAILAPLLLAALAGRAAADLVITTDGRLLQGTARLDADGALTVVQRAGPNVRVDLARVLSARFDNPSPGLARGVVLTSGSALPADEILALPDGKTLRLLRPSTAPLDLPLASVATVVFSPRGAVPLPPPSSGDAPGVLLKNGDFFEGDLLSLAKDRLVVGSTLFGDRTFSAPFDPQSDLVLLRIRTPADPTADPAADAKSEPAKEPGPRFVVRLTDGTVARSSFLRSEKSRLLFDDPLTGPQSAARDDLAELRSGAADLRPLDLKLTLPAPTPPSSGVPAALRGRTPWGHGALPRLVPAGAELSADLAGKATAVFLRAGVPPALLPVQQVRLAVYLDNQRVYRSPPLSSLDDPLVVALNATGKQRLTLKVESEAQGTPPLAAELVVSDAAVVTR